MLNQLRGVDARLGGFARSFNRGWCFWHWHFWHWRFWRDFRRGWGSYRSGCFLRLGDRIFDFVSHIFSSFVRLLGGLQAQLGPFERHAPGGAQARLAGLLTDKLGDYLLAEALKITFAATP